MTEKFSFQGLSGKFYLTFFFIIYKSKKKCIDTKVLGFGCGCKCMRVYMQIEMYVLHKPNLKKVSTAWEHWKVSERPLGMKAAT